MRRKPTRQEVQNAGQFFAKAGFVGPSIIAGKDAESEQCEGEGNVKAKAKTKASGPAEAVSEDASRTAAQPLNGQKDEGGAAGLEEEERASPAAAQPLSLLRSSGRAASRLLDLGVARCSHPRSSGRAASHFLDPAATPLLAS